MSELPKGMEGEPLTIDGREVEFSLWPTKVNGQSCELNYRIYVSDPWPFLRDYISRKYADDKDKHRRDDAINYLWQAEDYYRAALTASIDGAKPVLLFYCFENLVKSAVLCQDTETDFRQYITTHGLGASTNKLRAFYSGITSRGNTQSCYIVSIFHEFLKLLHKQASQLEEGQNEYPLSGLVPQILMGHRIWASANNETDRFVRANKIQIMQSQANSQVWLRIKVDSRSLLSCKFGCKELLKRSGLYSKWHQIQSDEDNIITLEQHNAERFTDNPLNKLKEMTCCLRPRLWQAAVTTPPYRKYYLYATPNEEHDELLPQLASMYALMFYLSDLTRYHPSEFYDLRQSPLGPFYMGLLQDSPKQFLYLFASEMMQREVSSGDQV